MSLEPVENVFLGSYFTIAVVVMRRQQDEWKKEKINIAQQHPQSPIPNPQLNHTPK